MPRGLGYPQLLRPAPQRNPLFQESNRIQIFYLNPYNVLPTFMQVLRNVPRSGGRSAYVITNVFQTPPWAARVQPPILCQLFLESSPSYGILS